MDNNWSSGSFSKILPNHNMNLIRTVILIRVTCDRYMVNERRTEQYYLPVLTRKYGSMLSKSLFLRWSVDNLDRLMAGGIRGKYTSTQCTSPKLSYDLVHEHKGLNEHGWKSCKKLSASARHIHNTDSANIINR